ncbi:centrosomal protein of 164 kDa-like [Actinia tenebrosa]|uniref:Centrosomal protein of 164 kDa n=1 Tax=Actinia tenebrosa TaxID=6105 RepID=A0A6P8HIF3_ACTTE|nr:centrosomal protein of 164 kDa-like [Actinia tenebrosa]
MMANNVINGQVILEEEYDESYEPTENEVYEYAQLIGIDPDTEKSLLWIAREGIVAPLPPDWKPCQDSQGEIYYFNFGTGESVWDHPCDEYYRTMVIEERAKMKKAGSGPKKDKKKDKKDNKKVKILDPPVKQKGIGLSPLKGEVPLGSLGALAPLKSPSPAVLGSSMNSSLGGSSFGVDSLEGSLGRSLGGPRGDQGGGARFSSKPSTQDPFLQKALGGIKHGGMGSKLEKKQDPLESSNEHDPVVINLNTSLGDNINLNLMADSSSEDELDKSPQRGTFDFGAHDIAALGYEESDIEESSNLKQPNTPSISDMDDGEEVDFGINPSISNRLEGMSSDIANIEMKSNNKVDVEANQKSGGKLISAGTQEEDDRERKARILAEAAERRAVPHKNEVVVEQEHKKLASEAASTLQDLRKTMEKELEEAKHKLKTEKEDSLERLRKQLKQEEEKEEERLKQQHEIVMKTLGEKAKEEALDEEAMLQEGKQDALRKLRIKIQQEKEEEEATLKKEKEKAIDEMKDELEDEQEQLESNLKEDQQRSLKQLKEKLAAEFEKEKKKYEEDHHASLDGFKEKIEKEKELAIEKLQQQNEYVLQLRKNELIEKHEKAMEDVLSELDQVQTIELDENEEALAKAKTLFDEKMDLLDVKMSDDYEKKKKALESKYEEQLESLRAEWEKKIYRVKQDWKEQENKEKYELTEKWEREKEDMANEHEEIMTELRNDCEAKRQVLQQDWESLSSKLDVEKEDLETQRKEQDKLRKELMKEKKELEKQEKEIKHRKEELAAERKNLLQSSDIDTHDLRDVTDQLAEKNSKLRELDNQLHRSNQEIQKKERIKAKLNQEIEELTATRDGLQNSINEIKSRYQKMQQNYRRQEQDFNELQKKQEGLQAKLEQMNTNGDLDDTLVGDDDNDIDKHRHVAKGKHSKGSKTSYPNGRISREEALQLEDLEPNGVSASKKDGRHAAAHSKGKSQRRAPSSITSNTESEMSDSPGEISPQAQSRNSAFHQHAMWQSKAPKAHGTKPRDIDISSDESSQDEYQQNLLLLQKQAEFRNAELKKRLVVECDAINKAKRFLSRHKKSVRKRQAALEQARSEWKHDVTTNINRGKPVSSRNATLLEDVKSKLEEEEAELTIVVDNMNAGQELLRQKEERLKILENALLGGMSTTTSDSEDVPMDPLFRKTAHFPKDKYRPHRSTRRQIEDDDSSGFSSSDYGDGPPVVRDVRGSRGTKSLRFSNPSKTQNIDDVQASLSTINTDLARILSLLQTQTLQRPAIPTQPVYAVPEQHAFAQTARPMNSGYAPSIDHAQTSRPDIAPRNSYHQPIYKSQDTAEVALERKWKSYFGDHNRDSPASLSLGATLKGHITARDSNGPGVVKEKLTDWTSEGQLNVAERLQNHADWLRNFRREMGLQSPSQSNRGNMASSARYPPTSQTSATSSPGNLWSSQPRGLAMTHRPLRLELGKNNEIRYV